MKEQKKMCCFSAKGDNCHIATELICGKKDCTLFVDKNSETAKNIRRLELGTDKRVFVK
jgi:hypothetical protein